MVTQKGTEMTKVYNDVIKGQNGGNRRLCDAIIRHCNGIKRQADESTDTIVMQCMAIAY